MSKHITEEQRYAISMMLQIPMSKKAIAEAIGIYSQSTMWSYYTNVKKRTVYHHAQITVSLATFSSATYFLCIQPRS